LTFFLGKAPPVKKRCHRQQDYSGKKRHLHLSFRNPKKLEEDDGWASRMTCFRSYLSEISLIQTLVRIAAKEKKRKKRLIFSIKNRVLAVLGMGKISEKGLMKEGLKPCPASPARFEIIIQNLQ
jgi:hypothetical protein